MFNTLLPCVTVSSGNVLATALLTRYPKRQTKIAAACLQFTARITADVYQRFNKNKVEAKSFAFTNSLTGHISVNSVYSAKEATLHVSQHQHSCFLPLKPCFLCASPGPCAARSVFFIDGSERKTAPPIL